MSRSEILEKLTIIFKDVLKNKEIILTEVTTATDILDWDSLNQIRLVVAIEQHFKVRFLNSEIQIWKNVGVLIDLLESKIN